MIPDFTCGSGTFNSFTRSQDFETIVTKYILHGIVQALVSVVVVDTSLICRGVVDMEIVFNYWLQVLPKMCLLTWLT